MEKELSVLIFWYTLNEAPRTSELSISDSFLAVFPLLVMQRISSFIHSLSRFALKKNVMLIFFDPFLFFVQANIPFKCM